jgi:hypothetical protein
LKGISVGIIPTFWNLESQKTSVKKKDRWLEDKEEKNNDQGLK